LRDRQSKKILKFATKSLCVQKRAGREIRRMMVHLNTSRVNWDGNSKRHQLGRPVRCSPRVIDWPRSFSAWWCCGNWGGGGVTGGTDSTTRESLLIGIGVGGTMKKKKKTHLPQGSGQSQGSGGGGETGPGNGGGGVPPKQNTGLCSKNGNGGKKLWARCGWWRSHPGFRGYVVIQPNTGLASVP